MLLFSGASIENKVTALRVSPQIHRIRKVQFFNIVKKSLLPPPPFRLNIVVNFSEGILTKVRKRQSQQNNA